MSFWEESHEPPWPVYSSSRSTVFQWTMIGPVFCLFEGRKSRSVKGGVLNYTLPTEIEERERLTLKPPEPPWG